MILYFKNETFADSAIWYFRFYFKRWKMVTQIQILKKGVSLHTNALGKGMNPSVILQAMGKW